MSSCLAQVGNTCHELSTGGDALFGVTRFDKKSYLERRTKNGMVPDVFKENAVSLDLRVLTGESDASIGGDQCSIYMAKSSIPNAGFGTFAGIEKKGFFESDCSEVVIPLIDIEKHFPSFQSTVLSNYLWRSHGRGAQFESDTVDIIQPNLGMASNGHLALYNLNTQYDFFRQWSSISNRTQAPSTGAYSSYTGLNFGASNLIEPGMELFLDYGPGYFSEREEETGMIFPSDIDHGKADTIVKDFLKRIEKEEDRKNIDMDYANTIEDLAAKDATKRVAVALPKSTDELKSADQVGTARYALSDSHRSLPWLAENGLCLDNFQVGLSSIAQAGKGAFVTHASKAGTVISPVPLLPVSRETLHMYNFDAKGSHLDVYSHQLLLNYCFGHPKSSMLFFPYSSKVQYINHNGKNPNAILRWSSSKLNNMKMLEWRMKDMKAGLMLEVVATRDIEVGEEVTINYGTEWEKAWLMHTENWSISRENIEANPTYAMHVLDMKGDIIRTMKEQQTKPYPSCVRTACFTWVSNGEFRYATKEFSTLRPCDIIGRVRKKDGTYRYSAKVHETEYFDSRISDSAVLTDIPREAMSFIVEPYCSDQHFLGTFRHEIGLPEDIYPETWLDLN